MEGIHRGTELKFIQQTDKQLTHSTLIIQPQELFSIDAKPKAPLSASGRGYCAAQSELGCSPSQTIGHVRASPVFSEMIGEELKVSLLDM